MKRVMILPPLILSMIAAIASPHVVHAANGAGATAAGDEHAVTKVDKIPYERFTLPNGLTTIVYTDHSQPSVFVGLWYKTGSRDEPPGKAGFAHLFEHLMFQHTANRKEEYMAALHKIGAVNANGQTARDYTVYFETVPTNALDAALWLESDRMGFLDGGITQALLDEQRRVVLNEKRQGELNPGEKAQRHLLSAFYPPDHPYAHPTIGSTADLERATLADVKQWFHDYYGAGNAVLVLSGDIDAAEAKEKVTRYFAAIRPGEPISRPLQWTPQRTETRRDRLYGAFPAAAISRNWAIPNDDPHALTLLLLAARAMTGRQDAPLVRALVQDEKVALSVDASVDTNALNSMLTVMVELRPGVSPEAAEKAIDRAIADYAANGPSPDRLQAIVSASDASLLRSLESIAAMGNWLGEGEVRHDDPTYFLRQRDWITDATAQQVRAVAAKWLGKPYYELITLPDPKEKAAAQDVDRSHMPAVGPVKTSVDFPVIHETRLDNGLKIVVARRRGVPMVDVRLQFDNGSLSEPDDMPGLSAMAYGLLSAGTAERSDAQISDALSRLGMQFGIAAGDWSSSVQWSVPASRLDDSFALVSQLVRKPAYPQAAVREANASAKHQVAAYASDPVAAGPALLARAIWGPSDPRGRIVSPAGRHDITRSALIDYHEGHMVPGAATLYVVGDIAQERVDALARHYLGDWKAKATPPAHTLRVAPEGQAGPRLILVDAPGAEQSSITLGQAVGPFDPDRSASETIVTAALADGGTGRLTDNLRQAKGWTYDFRGTIDDAPQGDRLFVAGGTVQADRTADSLVEIRKEIEALVTSRPITRSELDMQRADILQKSAQQFSNNAAFLRAIGAAGTYQLPYNRATTLETRLNAVTPEQANQLARSLFHPDALTWVVVGDLKKIEPQIRALDIAPVEVWDAYGNRLR